jgi:hypothetical protein
MSLDQISLLCKYVDTTSWLDILDILKPYNFYLKHFRNSSYLKHSDRKITQPVLKYLLKITIHFNSTDFTNTQYRRVYTTACAGDVILQPARASPSVVVQQSKWKDVFFTGAVSVHCRTLPGISYLLKLPERVLRHFSRFSCAKRTDCISSGETFPWHRKRAGQKPFRSTFGVKWL